MKLSSILDTQYWRIRVLEIDYRDISPSFELEIKISEGMCEGARAWLEVMREMSGFDESYQSELRRYILDQNILRPEMSPELELGGEAGLQKIVLSGGHTLEYIGERTFKTTNVHQALHFAVLLSIFRKWAFQVEAHARMMAFF